MNVLPDDILCQTLPLTVSSSFSGSDKDEVHLLDSLSSFGNVGSAMVSLTANDIQNDVYQALDPVHSSENLMTPNFQVPSRSDQQLSHCLDNSSQNTTSYLQTNDYLKDLEHVSLTGMLPPMVDIHPAIRNSSHHERSNAGFPHSLPMQNGVMRDLNKSFISSGQKLIDGDSSLEVISSTDTVLLPTFSNINSTSMHLPANKGVTSQVKLKGNSVPSLPNSSSEPIITAIMSLSEHCGMTSPKELLNPSLSNPISTQCLTNPINTVTQNQEKSHSIELVSEKLPNITLTQLDSLFEGNNPMQGMQVLSNNFSAVSISQDISCNGSLQDSVMVNCNTAIDTVSCGSTTLTNLNLNPLAQQQTTAFQIAEPLCQTVMESEIEPRTFGSNVNSFIEETQCFKCKLCLFISLSRFQVFNHVRDLHLKNNSSVGLSGLKPAENRNINVFPNDISAEKNNCITALPPNTSNSVTQVSDYNSHATSETGDVRTYQIQKVLPRETLFLCGICDLHFPSLKDCRTHITSDHNIMPKFLSLESTKEKGNNFLAKSLGNKLAPRNSETLTKGFASIGKYTFACGKCEMTFTSIKDCKLHLASVHNINFAQNSRIVSGSDPSHQKRILPDRTSEAADENSSKKGGSKKINSDDKKLNCAPKQVSFHKKAWRKKVKREKGSFICEFKECNVRFRAIENLEYHKKCHVSGSNGFVCPECSTQFEQWGAIANHLWRSHNNDMELHACDQCPFRTYSLSRLENIHRQIHTNEYLFLCDTCGKSFKTRKQLRNHRGIHTKKVVKKRFECCICCRSFTSTKMIRLHMNTVHNKVKPHLCTFCDYAASNKASLKMHLRQHTGEKPFQCDMCAYQTSDHNSLRRHKMKHSGEKPYKCPYCTYACIQVY